LHASRRIEGIHCRQVDGPPALEMKITFL